MLVRQYFKNQNELLVIVCPRALGPTLLSLGLHHKEDFIFEAEVNSYVNSHQISEVNFILHHNEYSVSKFSEQFSEHLANVTTKSVSFYLDGYTNKAFYEKETEQVLKQKSDFFLKNVISFGMQVALPNHLDSATQIVIKGNLINEVRDQSNIKKIVSPLLEKMTLTEGKHIVLLAMRPWGSSSFHGGQFYFSDGAAVFSKMLEKIIENIRKEISPSSVDVLLKVDSRELDYCNQVLAKINTDSVCALKFPEFWPAWLNLDFFIMYAKEHFKSNFSLVTLDSSAGLPFLHSDYIDYQLIGVPDDALDLLVDCAAKRQIIAKSKLIVSDTLARVNVDDKKSSGSSFLVYRGT
mgnify:FL=1